LFAKKAQLKKAAQGTPILTHFFAPRPKTIVHNSGWGAHSASSEIEVLRTQLSALSAPPLDKQLTPSVSPNPPDHSLCSTDLEARNSPGASGPRDSPPHTPSATSQQDSVCPRPVQDTAPTSNINPRSSEPLNPTDFLDPTADDEDEAQRPAVGDVVKSLINEAKKHQSFAALFKLNAVKTYLEVLERYRRVPNIKNPVTRAGLVVAKSVGKGPYFARRIRKLVTYVDRFHTLPPNGSGKHHAHPSLLNNERIYQAVRRYLAVQEVGEVSTCLYTRISLTHII
jgi:hypothetical protein